ncbi:ABC transporter substrate-binding protein [Alkalibacter rhizosphaerae]|uniref:ABC transporter substrate-binding protein n=1 Tax=Alkalibacter rhizosphaerae TaxID=2815577 RepID=A0A975AH94_9FIRM|nr:ABC transporter substrate-binding protein [Alkalibacter rhizosphaerae]QSX08374.1 ABC transporter substrate-binding protein [Alkalibacter rhizosphaerae]
MKKNMIKRGILIGTLVFMMVMAGCSGSSDNNGGNDGENGSEELTAFPMTVTDTAGNEITIEAMPEKIISVSPTLTETLFAIGAGDRVVGRTEYCNYPEEVANIQVIGTFTNPNTELILDLEPDLVFSSGGVPEEAQALFDASGIKVIVLADSQTVDQIEENILLMGKVLDLNEEAAAVNEEIEAERTAVKAALGDVEPKRVFVDLGYYYSAGAGSFIDSIIVEELGAINIAADGEGEWPQISEEVIVEKDPEVYIRNVTMGGGEAEPMADSLQGITAVVENQVVNVETGSPDNDIMTRAGARVGQTIRFYAEAIYPEKFN